MGVAKLPTQTKRVDVERMVTPLVLLGACAMVHNACTPGHHGNNSVLPFCDTTLPVGRRVIDLVGRLTLAEKISQLTTVSEGWTKGTTSCVNDPLFGRHTRCPTPNPPLRAPPPRSAAALRAPTPALRYYCFNNTPTHTIPCPPALRARRARSAHARAAHATGERCQRRHLGQQPEAAWHPGVRLVVGPI